MEMSKVSNVVVMCLMALSVVAVNSAGQVKKINEPEYGKLYNLTVTGSDRVDWDIHVNYGDNVSINCTEVPGKPMGCDVSFSVDCIYYPLYYKTSCCDTTMDSGSAFYATSNRTIWFVAADDTVIHAALWNALANSQANYTINKVNATASGQSADISRLEAMVSSLNQTVNALNSSLSALTINFTTLSEHLQQTDGNLSALQEKLAEMSAEFKALSDNLTALKARLDSLNIPEAVNISGIQQNITDLSASYEDLYQNITELANRTGNITYQNITYGNQTLVTNETVVYAYDNGTVGNISKGLDDLSKRLGEVNKSLPEELAKMKNETKKDNNKSRDSISKELGESSAAMGAGVGLGAGIAAGAGTSMAIGKRNSRAPIKGRPEDEIVPTGGLKTGEPEDFPKPPEQDKGQ